MKVVVSSLAILLGLSACAPIQDTYKPLYQATPQKQAIERR